MASTVFSQEYAKKADPQTEKSSKEYNAIYVKYAPKVSGYSGFSNCGNFKSCLEKLIYRIKNCIKGLYFMSDWRCSKNELTAQLIKEQGLSLDNQKCLAAQEKMFSAKATYQLYSLIDGDFQANGDVKVGNLLRNSNKLDRPNEFVNEIVKAKIMNKDTAIAYVQYLTCQKRFNIKLRFYL